MPRTDNETSHSEGMFKRRQILPERANPEAVSGQIPNVCIQSLLLQNTGGGDAKREFRASNKLAETLN